MSNLHPHQPNILFILADDQGAWALGCAGNPEIRTPNLDRLAATGTRCENFFCASPVCSPARASILTGRIPSQHGVHDWLRAGNYAAEGPSVEYLQGQPGYTDFLAAAGYTCGLSGKWHLGDSYRAQKGFSYWAVHATGGGPYYGAPMIGGPLLRPEAVREGELYAEPRYVTDVITDNALAFLETQAGAGRPFYLGVHYTAPHSPWDRDNHPAELYDSYRRDCPFESIPRLPMHPWQVNSAPHSYDEAGRRDILSGYFSAVTALDANVGRLLDWLEAHGLREDTLVIFTGDNGMNMGHHGLYGKGNASFPLNMYDTSVKVPMIMSQPGAVAQGAVNRDLLSHYDLLPTLLARVGLADAVPAGLPGRSFARLLGVDAPAPAPNDLVVSIYDEYGPVRMIRTHDWKYVHRYPYGPHELYHLAEDPDETRNLIHEAAQQPRIRALKGELDDWFLRHVDPRIDGAREPVTGKGQLGLAGVAARGAPAFADDWRYLSETPDARR